MSPPPRPGSLQSAPGLWFPDAMPLDRSHPVDQMENATDTIDFNDLSDADKQLFLLIQSIPEEKFEAEECIRSFKYFVKAAWHVAEPGSPYIDGWHIDAMCDHIQACVEGRIKNLIISIPPRHSKSSCVSVLFPAWLWIKMPGKRSLFVSYAAQLSDRDSRKCRNLIESDWYQGLFGHIFQICDDSNTIRRFDNDKGGMRFATSVGGVLTGEGASFLCVHGDTVTETDIGPLKMRDIVEGRMDVKILSGNGNWQTINSWEKNPGKPMVEVCCSNGSSFRCTEDHPIFVHGLDCQLAKELKSIYATTKLYLRPLSNTLLSSPGPCRSGKDRFILFSEMLWRMGDWTKQSSFYYWEARDEVPGLSEAVQEGSQQAVGYEMLLQEVWRYIQDQSRGSVELSSLPARIRQELSQEGSEILFPGLCRYVSPVIHSRRREWSVHSREACDQVRSWIYKKTKGVYQGKRREYLRDLQASRRRNQGRLHWGPSFGWTEKQTRSYQFSNLVQILSSSTAQWVQAWSTPYVDRTVWITSIRSCEQTDFVYNLNVGPDHSYFANGILTHNCGDDVNSIQEIHSDVKREGANQTWDQVISSRINPPIEEGHFIIIAQRSHASDLIGHVKKKDEGVGKYTVLELPAEYDPSMHCRTFLGVVDGAEVWWEDPRKVEGELLWPIGCPKDYLDGQKVALGAYAYAAQYQQRPVPKGGGIFNLKWFQRYWPIDLPHYSFWDDSCISVDMNFGSKDPSPTQNSWVVASAWARVGARYFLIDMIRGQWQYTESKHHIKAFILYWAMIWAKYVENKANGPAIMDDLMETEGMDGIIPIDPKDWGGDKKSRAYSITPICEALNVYLPHEDSDLGKRIMPIVLEELETFPMGATNDFVDTFTQAMNKMRARFVAMGLGVGEGSNSIEAQFEVARRAGMPDQSTQSDIITETDKMLEFLGMSTPKDKSLAIESNGRSAVNPMLAKPLSMTTPGICPMPKSVTNGHAVAAQIDSREVGGFTGVAADGIVKAMGTSSQMHTVNSVGMNVDDQLFSLQQVLLNQGTNHGVQSFWKGMT